MYVPSEDCSREKEGSPFWPLLVAHTKDNTPGFVSFIQRDQRRVVRSPGRIKRSVITASPQRVFGKVGVSPHLEAYNHGM